MSWLTKLLGISGETNDQLNERAEQVDKAAEGLGEGVEKIGTATEFLENVADRLEGDDLCTLGDAIEWAVPWAETAADVIGEAVPPVKAIMKVVSFLTKETDPRALGLLVFSLAYQSALSETVLAIQKDPEAAKRIGSPVKASSLRRLLAGEPERLESFENFRLNSCLRHPLVRRADENLLRLAEAVGWPEDLRRRLMEGVHFRFSPTFRRIMTDGRTGDKFDPLFKYVEIDAREEAGIVAIKRHIEYQLWCFNRAPALGNPQDVERGLPMTLGCPLSEIYLTPDCGVLEWGQIEAMKASARKHGPRRTPFDESEGGRHPMLEQVIRLIGDPEFKDAIVIQGVAGAGKSAFTLHLCAELRRRGLRPIRIRMRHLLLDGRTSLFEDMGQAIVQNSGDQSFDKATNLERAAPGDFDVRGIFDEAFGDAEICPYVVIFDGWDEISVSASEGFRQRIDDTLYKIRRLIIEDPRCRVRVILTGRPSFDVQEVGFLRAKTPVLTVRPLLEGQVKHFADCLLDYRVKSGRGDRTLLRGRIDTLLEQVKVPTSCPATSESEWILGLPLLALLAIWLTLNDTTSAEVVGSSRTALYRRLVDMTCKFGGNVEELGSASRLVGDQLRDLLRRTAATMTILGKENISYAELEHRLRAAGLESRDEAVKAAMRDNPVASLMISFFFSISTREHGCEFVHKSFREYLFAEAVVDALKHIADRPLEADARSPYWKEFPEGDPRRAAIQSLAPLLAAQWISGEVARHVTALIAWELGRAAANGGLGQGLPDETLPISLDDWQAVRDTLTDLWDWWAEGVHLRPQPYHHPDTAALTYAEPYVVRIVKMLAPTDLPRDQVPEPIRTVTADAHLGDALFRVNCAVHFRINEATGWLERTPQAEPGWLPRLIWAGAKAATPRKYQTRIVQDDRDWVAFAPSTPDGTSHYMEHYCNRINSAGWRPESSFPLGIDMSGVDLAGASIAFPGTEEDINIPPPMSVRYARISGTSFFQSCVWERADFSYTAAQGFKFVLSFGLNCSFRGADLADADFSNSAISGWDFEDAALEKASFYKAFLADVEIEQLKDANLEEAFISSSSSRVPKRSARPGGGILHISTEVNSPTP